MIMVNTIFHVTATPDEGYQLTRLYYVHNGGTTEISTTASHSITMPCSDITIYAVFELISPPVSEYNITVVSDETDVQVSCPTTARSGDLVVLEGIYQDSDFMVRDLYYYGISSGRTEDIYAEMLSAMTEGVSAPFVMPAEDIIIYVVVTNRSQSFYSITTATADNGVANCVRLAATSTIVEVFAFPNEGYELVETYYTSDYL